MHILVISYCCLDELLCGMKLIVVGSIPKQTSELKKYYFFFLVLKKIEKKIVIIGLKETIPMPVSHCSL